MPAVCRRFFAAAGAIASLLGAAANAEQPKPDEDLPYVDNDTLFVVFEPIKRAADGMRLDMPIGVTNVRRDRRDVYVTITDASAWDDQGKQCSFAVGNATVTGLPNSRERKDAVLLQFGTGVAVTLSMACEHESKGKFFIARVEFGMFVVKSERGVRVGAGQFRLGVAK